MGGDPTFVNALVNGEVAPEAAIRTRPDRAGGRRPEAAVAPARHRPLMTLDHAKHKGFEVASGRQPGLALWVVRGLRPRRRCGHLRIDVRPSASPVNLQPTDHF